jgi:alkyldihydroxyacetonephosphate synthase
MKKENYIPLWRETPPAENSWRSIFKWGDPDIYKHPNKRLYALLKEKLELTDDFFRKKENEGDTGIKSRQKQGLPQRDIRALERIAGEKNISSADYQRIKYSTGKTAEEQILLRGKKHAGLCDIVVHPKNRKDVEEIIGYCNRKKIPVYTYGGGSSVNFGYRPARGGICLVMKTHMDRLININELNQTVTVEPGIRGPELEKLLNTAAKIRGTKYNYTCGHFPQSFQYSTVGGWISALGSGQQSTYYGDASDLVLAQEYITPAGNIKTRDYPSAATGPDINKIMNGSEGSFGVMVEATMKIFRYMPRNRKYFSFIFPKWESAVSACREIMQGEFGNPSVLRISDPEETDAALKLYGIEGTPLDTIMKIRNLKPGERSLLIGSSDGQSSYTAVVKKQVKGICRNYKGVSLTGLPVKMWEHGRYTDPYMREDLLDYGIIIDTLETSVKWDNLHYVHETVREHVKRRDAIICMSHCSHFYPQGTNLYFIFIMRLQSLDRYREFLTGVINSIVKSGGSLSHHHGVGRLLSPWMEKYLGKREMDILRAIKKQLDPKNIMNPGNMGL